jgi:D-xylose reductase
MTLSFPLKTGHHMPAIGAGMWKVDKPAVSQVVQQAIRSGYRHLDCACDYGNEAEVGDGIRAALKSGDCRREDLWVTSKLWNNYHRPEHVRLAVERSLHDLGLDYLDLYLVHFPIALEFVPFEKRYPPGWLFNPDDPQQGMRAIPIPLAETWQGMEDLVQAGLVRNIGVCNYNCALLRDLLSYATIRPAVLQVELHPYLTQEKLLRFCHQEEIVVTGFSPLGALSYFSLGMAGEHESVLTEGVVGEAARRHGKTPAQIALRWGVQRGTAVIPKTSQPARLAENLAIFDFALSTDEMQSISALNRNRRFNDPGDFCEKAFHTFFPIYE